MLKYKNITCFDLEAPKTAHQKHYGLENVHEPENCYRVASRFFLTVPKIWTFVYTKKDRKPCEFYLQIYVKL